MAFSSSTTDDRAAFLQGCINKKRSMKDAHEYLGLYSQTLSRKDPDFQPPEANELYASLKRTAQSLAAQYRGSPTQLRADLGKEDVLSAEVETLANRHGPTIWTPRNKRPNDTEWPDWSNVEHRKIIRFYLHCWIACLALKGISTVTQKAKGKRRAREPGTRGDDPMIISDDDSSDSSSISNRGPEAARSPVTNTVAKVKNNTTPSKRKSVLDMDESSPGKLARVSKIPTERNIPFRRAKDVFDVPSSPSRVTSTYQHRLGGDQLHRGATQDSDRTWQSRDQTADTETVVGSNDISQTELHDILQDEVAWGESSWYEKERSVTVGPSNTYRKPIRQDSVEPEETRLSSDLFVGTEVTPVRLARDSSEVQWEDQNNVIDFAPMTTQPLAMSPRDSRQREQRMELFKLLISYLHRLNQFSLDSYDPGAEDRMDFLLNQFRQLDMITATTVPSFRARTETSARIDTALRTWIIIRRSVDDFRRTTNYFGEPGRPWEMHLASMENLPCAQASLAYVELQERAWKHGVRSDGDTFDDDLMTGFDALTKIKGVNGKDAFRSVRQFNASLREWFREE